MAQKKKAKAKQANPKKAKSRFAKDLERAITRPVSRKASQTGVEYNPKYKLFYYGDSPKVRTGFGRVAYEILSRLYMTGKYEIHCLGINDQGDPTDFQGPGIYHYPLPHLREDPYGQGRFPNLVKQVRPDAIFVLQDIFVLEGMERNGTKNWWMKEWKQNAGHTPWIYYFPVDSRPWREEWVNLAFSADKTIVYSRYAQEVFKEITNLEPIYIPHGVNIDAFSVIPDGERKMVRQKIGVPEDKFLIGFISRNQPRKNPAGAFEIFKMANEGYRKCKTCENVRNLNDHRCEYCGESNKDSEQFPSPLEGNGVFYPHFNWKDPMGVDLTTVIAANGGCANVLARHNHDIAHGLPQEQFNAVINALDCHFLPTMAEGFGLTVIETMAAGVLNIATRTTAVTEQLEDDRGILVTPKNHIIFDDSSNTRKHVIDYEEAIHALAWAYEDWKNRGEGRWGPKTKPMIDSALEYCRRHAWDGISERFDEEIQDAIKSRVSIAKEFAGRSEGENFLFARIEGTPGDVLQTLHPIRAFRKSHPSAKIIYAIPESSLATMTELKFGDIIDKWLRVDRLSDAPPKDIQPPPVSYFDMYGPEMRWAQATYPYNDKSIADIYSFHLSMDGQIKDQLPLVTEDMLPMDRGKELMEAQLEDGQEVVPGFTVCLIPEAYERRKAWGDGLNKWEELCSHAEKMDIRVVTIDSNASFVENVALAACCDLVITVDNSYCDFLRELGQETLMLISPYHQRSRFLEFENCTFISNSLNGQAKDPEHPDMPNQMLEYIKPGEVFAKIFPRLKKWKKEHENAEAEKMEVEKVESGQV
jgi:glycosyltransferase involved in cell wall biosynthesis